MFTTNMQNVMWTFHVHQPFLETLILYYVYLIPQWTSPYFALKVAWAAHGLHPALSQLGIMPSGLCDFEILLRVSKSTKTLMLGS